MELKVGQTITCKKGMHQDGYVIIIPNVNYQIKRVLAMHFDIISEVGEYSFGNSEFVEYFTTEPPKKERYFIVFYNLNDSGYNHSVSFSQLEYPNKQEIVSIISNESRDLDVGITNIIELNQQDYESWNK